MIIAMIFLLLISLVASTAAETNSLQMHMAGNQQLQLTAHQRVMAITDAILADTDNTPVIGNVGFKICDADSTDTSCDAAVIALYHDKNRALRYQQGLLRNSHGSAGNQRPGHERIHGQQRQCVQCCTLRSYGKFQWQYRATG